MAPKRQTHLLVSVFCILSCFQQSLAQGSGNSFFVASDTFHPTRFWSAAGLTAGAYTATVIGLNEIWYKQYPRGKFNFQDDWGEWRNADKMGHMFAAYMYAKWMGDLAYWTGIDRKTSDWVGFGTSMLFQTTIEVLDGFSTQWGFSWSDIAFNTAGAGLYLGQQKLWGEQRISMKFSSTPVDHPDYVVISNDGESSMTLDGRAQDLFGRSYLEQLIKDYNAQTTWVSFNIHSFLNEQSRFPKWLNLAVGYGAFNMYGGYSNNWEKDGAKYSLDPDAFPRYSKFYIAPDIDLTRIPTRSPFLKTLFGMLNMVKVPAPTLEFNSQDGVRWHWLRF